MRMTALMIVAFNVLITGCFEIDQTTEEAPLSTLINSTPDQGVSPTSLPGYATSTGGWITLERISSLTLSAGQSFRGFAADSTQTYFLIRSDGGNGVIWWDLWRQTQGDSQLHLQCRMLDDGAITGGLTVEGSSFYVRTQRYYSDPARVQKMSINDCTSQGVIEFGTAWTCYQDSYTWSRALLTQINRGVFFRPFGCQDFRSYDLDRGTADPIFVEVRSGSKTLEARNITSVSAHDSTLWLTSHSDELWKLSESGAPIGWANLPTEEYPDLEDTLGSATPDKDHLILVALKGSTLKRFYFDLSHF